MRQAKKQKGMTLIELMIVVAIVAILAAIAYPSYQQYVIRANRSAAQTFMLAIANKQEQFLLDKRQYATAASITDIESALNISPPDGKVQELYGITIAHRTTSSRTYVITATPVAGTSQFNDGELTLNELGQKTPPGKW